MDQRDRKLVFAGIALFWALSALFQFTSTMYLLRWQGIPVPPLQLAPMSLRWLYYILLAPLCLWLPGRVAVRRDAWRLPLVKLAAIGLAASFVLSALDVATYAGFAHLQHRPTQLLSLIQKNVFLGAYSNWLIFAMTSAVIYALHHFREAQALERESSRHRLRVAELERHLVGAQLRALHMQLQPHFLFNTHHAINGLILKGETDNAVRMLTRLSDLLRLTLAQRDVTLVPFQQELELLGHYLEIQQIRFGDRLQVTIDAAAELMDANVPGLILQPLVENGIKHGLEKHTGPGWLRIEATRQDDVLTLAVENSGAVSAPSGDPTGHGIGLSTTRERLEQLYGSRHQFQLAPLPTGGVRAELNIPYHTAAAETNLSPAVTAP